MGTVYLVYNGEFYKIGITKRLLSERIKTLQTGSSKEIILINSYESSNYRKIETLFHQHHRRKRMIGEWFDLDLNDVNNFTDMAIKFDTTCDVLKDNPFF